MADVPLTENENPRIAAFARATGDGASGCSFEEWRSSVSWRFRDWIEEMKLEACEAGENGDYQGVFRFDKGGVTHINDHEKFTAFLETRAADLEAERDAQDAPEGP